MLIAILSKGKELDVDFTSEAHFLLLVNDK